MVNAHCRTCQQRYSTRQELTAHRVHAHGAIECRLCDKAFGNSSSLETHARTGLKHRAQHAIKCSIPGCNPRNCVGVSLTSVGVGSAENLSDCISATPTNVTTASSHPVVVPTRKGKTRQCYICDKSLLGKKSGLKMHMKDSAKHASLHSRVCQLNNCNPTKCSGRAAVNYGKTPVVDSEERQRTSIASTTGGAATPSVPCRTIVEPGPPDPMPAPIATENLRGPTHSQLASASKGSTTPNTIVAPRTNVSSVMGRNEAGPPDLLTTGPPAVSVNRKASVFYGGRYCRHGPSFRRDFS
ncbi:hypothetical protein BKA70DRAFT_1272543 [Coprinopsis sp. MPI-PUGE-AT-0042]|nr:hypothetical protein BKA70DRAFT_1272543 [Coprinopsis sp. MPI-PUGE-AT-0042]